LHAVFRTETGEQLAGTTMRHIKFDGVSNEIERRRAPLVLTTLLNQA
jgi:hypothetical protein